MTRRRVTTRFKFEMSFLILSEKEETRLFITALKSGTLDSVNKPEALQYLGNPIKMRKASSYCTRIA
ncbi:jg13173, partial [Pararge aegeria aegeria]